MNQVTNSIQKIWNENPLHLVMFVAIITRLLAAFFSRGFGMHDDHFLVIEVAQAWLDGIFVPGHLYGQALELTPDGHSLFYMGLHYLLFKFLAVFGIYDPLFKMLIVRILHALASIYSVWLTYKITEKLSSKKDAALAGLLMASMWFLPMLSVRNLVEIFCFPFTLAGIWYLINAELKKHPLLIYLLAGFILGLSISIRFQLIVYVGGVGLVLLIQRKWIPAFIFGFGALLSILIFQGLMDYFIWGYPFAEFIEYVKYNIQEAYNYINGPWYNYLLLLAGIFIPPVSLMLLFGFFRVWKKQLIIFLPAFLFLVFHSFFPNKQERFIFPFVPYLIIGGVIGWNSFLVVSKFWKNHQKALSRSWIFFWLLNFILLIPVSTAYSKRSRVEAMAYLANYPGIKVVVAEDTNKNSAQMLPRYYSGQWMQVLYKSETEVRSYTSDSIPCSVSQASFVMFYSDENLQARVDSLKKEIPSLVYEKTFMPGMIDEIMHRLNPVNRNETIYLYRNNDLTKKNN
ncbi:MAG: glycosyltransferase family 39 protein [Bacteroidales bacterium]|nr:glycosyltransferase family 39 protein [Bacteroidales bacterium]